MPRRSRRSVAVRQNTPSQQPESRSLRNLIDSSLRLPPPHPFLLEETPSSRLKRSDAERPASSTSTAQPAFRTADEDPILPPLPTLPPGEAIALPPTDLTPTDGPPDAPTRVPHLGHAILFVSLTGLLLLVTNVAILGLHHPATVAAATRQLTVHPKLILAAEAVTYLATIAISFFLFPLLWVRPFLTGLHWNAPAARRNLPRLIPLGLALSFTIQAASSLVPMPRDIPLDDFFRNPSDVWLITLFGTLLAPAFEEICFRGFFFPAFAIAYDWLSLPRTEAARDSWNATNALTNPALVFSAVLTSILFAMLHAQQIGFAWPILLLLFLVSLVLTFVRYRLRSVAASALVHASYNFAIFLLAFIATGGYRHLDRMPH